DDVNQEQGHLLRSSIGRRGGIVIENKDDEDDGSTYDRSSSGFNGEVNDDDGEDNDIDDGNGDDTTDEDVCEDDTELRTLPEARRVTGNALNKLRNGVKKIRHVLSENFKALTTSEKTPSGLRPLLDVRTRWNSTYVMVRRALQCQNAYQMVLTDGGHGDLALSAVEWTRLKALKSL
ncbi:hypothetical protein BGX20_007404, partial [Mortierella sp. AD010]